MDREVRRLVPRTHKRSEHRHKIIQHPDSRREKSGRGGGGGGGVEEISPLPSQGK